MLKKLSLFAVALFALVNFSVAQRACGTMDHLQYLQQQDPTVGNRMQDIEQFTQQYIQNHHDNDSRSLTTIPVVVHVVWHTSDQNISDAQVLSQITVLNKDFTRTNSDTSNTPSVWKGIAANPNINFCMASIDPNGAPTTGIRRVQTSQTSFTTDDKVKYTSQGGDDAWPSASYFNIWVCPLGGNLLGYAQFPGGPSATDGVVILYDAFGNTGNVFYPYNTGRTATHETGHWLNLYHIWGDDNGACNGSDQVGDTPNQGSENYGCPAFPHVSCSNGPNGDMFMNYMDYTDDACMNIFTAGQSTRMNALFASGGARHSLLSSNGCGSATCNVPTGMTTTGIGNTGATFNWTAVSGASSYNIRYKATSSNTWITATSSTNSKAIVGLSTCTDYEWQVQTVCSFGNSLFTASTNFTTTGCSSCGVATGMFTNMINSVSAKLNWTAVSGATSYNIRYRVVNAPNWITTTSSSAHKTISDLAACANYEWQVQVVCSSGNGNFTASTLFTTTRCHCVSTGLSTAHEYINNVNLSTLDNTSGNNNGYANFTNLVLTLAQSNGYTFTGTPGFTNGTYTEYWRVWVDWNQDGDFLDSGEQAFSSTGSTTSVVGTIAVPATAATGYTTMRVAMKYSALPTSCESFQYGEVEDYTIKVVAGAACHTAYEPNNTSGTAYPINVTTMYNGFICPTGDDDWYSFANTSSKKNIKISLTSLPADYDVQLYNPNNVLVGSSTNGGTQNETIIYNNTATAGTYKIRVYGYSGAMNNTDSYILKAQIKAGNWTGRLGEEDEMDAISTSDILTNVDVYPNPANDYVNISFNSTEDGQAHISVMDVLGQQLYESDVDVLNGDNVKNIDLSKFSKGYYLISIKEGDNTIVQKFLVQ